MTMILKGCIVSAPALGRLETTEHGYLIAENGHITGIYPVLPEQYAGAPVEDYGDDLIVQSFADLHLHAPQYPMLGTGMDLPLLDWLNTYAFPTEARFADTDYARTVYRQLSRELIAHGTTRVCMFSSLHTEATLILMEELERAGVTGYVGKVNMDRNGLPGVLEETSEASMRDTLRWLDRCQDTSADGYGAGLRQRGPLRPGGLSQRQRVHKSAHRPYFSEESGAAADHGADHL